MSGKTRSLAGHAGNGPGFAPGYHFIRELQSSGSSGRFYEIYFFLISFKNRRVASCHGGRRLPMVWARGKLSSTE